LRRADADVLELETRLAVLKTLLNPEALAVPRNSLMRARLIGRQVPRLICLLGGMATLYMAWQPPAQGHVDPEVAWTTLVVLTVAHLRSPPQFARLQTFRSEPPALTVGSDQASPSGDTHHIVQTVLLEPREKGSAPKATIRQDDGADAARQSEYDR